MSRRVSDEAALSAMSLEELWRLFPVILSESRPEKCGYREMHRDEAQMRLVLVKGYAADGFRGQAFHLHVRPCRDWDELYFRDYLAAHPDEAERYAALKRSLKEKFEFNRDAYTEGKTELIAAMTRRAREEMPGRHVPA